MPTQLSILNLLLTFESYVEVLLKILNESQVPMNIPLEKFSYVIENVLAFNHITFSNDDLILKRFEHNRPLYISVRCNGKLALRVLIDNGSTLNICPWNILTKLGFLDVRFHPSTTVVRG